MTTYEELRLIVLEISDLIRLKKSKHPVARLREGMFVGTDDQYEEAILEDAKVEGYLEALQEVETLITTLTEGKL